MASYQTALEYAHDQLRQGKVTLDEANVMIVQIMGVREITAPLPASVRRALNSAVKSGELGHRKKDGLKPEVYHHKNAKGTAIEHQRRREREKIEALKKIVG